MDQRPPPEVTIRDPARPDRPVDVLELGEEPPAGAARALTLPRATAAVAALVLLAGVAVAGDLRERQRAAAEEQRLASVVDLRVGSVASTSASYERDTDSATIELVLPVRNRGPRDVVVLSGGIGGYGVARPVELRPGARGMLRLTQTVDCDAWADPAAPPLGTIELSVRTAAQVQPRRVSLPLPNPLTDEAAQHMCGFMVLEQTTTLAVVDVLETAPTLRLTVEATTTARSPVELTTVEAFTPGFAATSPDLSAGPVVLPPAVGEGVGRSTVQVELTLVDCDAVAADPEPLGLVFSAEDDRRRQASLHLHLDPSLRRTLLDSSC